MDVLRGVANRIVASVKASYRKHHFAHTGHEENTWDQFTLYFFDLPSCQRSDVWKIFDCWNLILGSSVDVHPRFLFRFVIFLSMVRLSSCDWPNPLASFTQTTVFYWSNEQKFACNNGRNCLLSGAILNPNVNYAVCQLAKLPNKDESRKDKLEWKWGKKTLFVYI